MHNVGSRSIWRRAGQMLSVLIVATLVVFGLGNNPSRAATPVLNVSITRKRLPTIPAIPRSTPSHGRVLR